MKFRTIGPYLVLGLVTACSAASSDTGEPQTDYVTVELSTVGVDPQSESPVVLLREGMTGRVLPIWVGIAEAQAIARALHGVDVPRPMTHDLLANVLRDLEAEVQEVVVRDLRDGTYYGAIRLKVNGRGASREVDSRPSDALALALRTGAPIRVARWILDEAPDVDFMAPSVDQQVVQAVGLVVVAPTDELREEFDLPDRPGVVVARAFGEAEAAGVERGDLVLEVNGVVPGSPIEFFQSVRGTEIGQPVRLRVWRKGEESAVEVMPTAPPRTGPKRTVRTEA